jgi:ubiquinone/menaquinone biosynthesis C-methylase UbiE
MSEIQFNTPKHVQQVATSETNFATRFIEGPCMERMTPDLIGKRVLSIACGAGAECQRFYEAGAREVVGIDRSEGLVDEARKRYPHLKFQAMDMRQLNFPDASFDFAYSSKSMHYAPDWREVLVPLHSILSPNSRFLLSTHHPMIWGAEAVREGSRRGRWLGYESDNSTENDYTIRGNYLQGGPRREQLSSMQRDYYHKPFGEIFNEISDSGFRIEHLEEPAIVEAAKDQYERAYNMFSAFPLFMVMMLERL